MYFLSSVKYLAKCRVKIFINVEFWLILSQNLKISQFGNSAKRGSQPWCQIPNMVVVMYLTD